jgi:Na+(H+)/acetate symporter ActP
MADKPLKDQNRLGLALVAAANVVAFYGMSVFGGIVGLDWVQVGQAWVNVLPASLGVVLVGVLNAQLDADTKARLVHMKWRDPLPGSAAFTRLGPKDPRVDMQALTRRLRTLPTDPARQNAVWYGLYKEIRSEPAVTHANKEYLFTRDYHVFALGFLFAFGVASFWTVEDLAARAWYVAALAAQVLLTGQAARTHGKRLVCTVLAMSAKKPPVEKKK